MKPEYPLAPYSSRIGHARFRWAGQEQRTRPNFDASPHSVHGLAWQRPWRVEAGDAHSARLALTHSADADGPYAFDLEQHFELGDTGLHVTLRIVNTVACTQPLEKVSIVKTLDGDIPGHRTVAPSMRTVPDATIDQTLCRGSLRNTWVRLRARSTPRPRYGCWPASQGITAGHSMPS